MTLGGVTCDSILENEEQVHLAVKNQRIQPGETLNHSFIRPFLHAVPENQGSAEGDICSFAAFLIHLLSGQKLTDKERSDMEKKVIPEVVGKINDGAARDFIITACIE